MSLSTPAEPERDPARVARTLRDLADDPASVLAGSTNHEITREIAIEAAEAIEQGTAVSPELVARNYRQLGEHAKYAEGKRRELHELAAEGNAIAVRALELLADDPWWDAP